MNPKFHNPLCTNLGSADQSFRIKAFTLVELMVVIVIVSIVASLSLAGLGVARQKSKIEATKATIRKINEPIMEQYESYSQRVKGTSANDLGDVRAIMVEEMPDSWGNVQAMSSATTGPGRSYANYLAKSLKNPTAKSRYGSGECLYMIVTRSGIMPGSLENFRASEVGDVDKDGLKEFIDAWGNPILFFRWAPGFNYPLSAVQVADPTNQHDFLDPSVQDASAFQLYPLIYSAGPDQAGNSDDLSSDGYGLTTITAWPTASADLKSGICSNAATSGVGSPKAGNENACRDNVTNHDFLGRGR